MRQTGLDREAEAALLDGLLDGGCSHMRLQHLVPSSSCNPDNRSVTQLKADREAEAAGCSHSYSFQHLVPFSSCNPANMYMTQPEENREAEAAADSTAGSNPASFGSIAAADSSSMAASEDAAGSNSSTVASEIAAENTNAAATEIAAGSSSPTDSLVPSVPSQSADPAVQDSIIDWAEHLSRF